MPSLVAAGAAAGLDRLDRSILRLLQEDGRLSNVDLARRVGLSPSPCLRRVKALEQRGYIQRYAAVLSRALLGRDLVVDVLVNLTDQRQETLAGFEAAVCEIDDILRCSLIAGDADYLLTVAVENLDAYQRLFSRRLGELPGVASLKSLVTMKAVKDSRSLPL